MAYPAKLLGDDEHIVYESRPHWRVLIVPVLALLLIVAIAAFLLGRLGGDEGWRTFLQWAVMILAGAAVSYWVIRPVIFWATTLYVFTNRRVITRTGLVARTGSNMPLSRVSNVDFSHTVVERIFNCGTLAVETAGESGRLELRNVPDVEMLQRKVYELSEADDERRRRRLDDRGLPDDGF
jgi:uncharacterized membrane protein YdbT with pleckstrin-like domain